MKAILNEVINVCIDSKDKEKKNLSIEIKIFSNSNDLESVLKESAVIEKEYKEGKRQGYNNANEMIRSILKN